MQGAARGCGIVGVGGPRVGEQDAPVLPSCTPAPATFADWREKREDVTERTPSKAWNPPNTYTHTERELCGLRLRLAGGYIYTPLITISRRPSLRMACTPLPAYGTAALTHDT